MKNKLGKKGFTLVELLAVIVVLAIIMVIATTQINGTIKKSRTDSFVDSVSMISKNANLLCAQSENGTITKDELLNTSGITSTSDDYTISLYNYNDDSNKGNLKIIVEAKGKFSNMGSLTKREVANVKFKDNGKDSESNGASNAVNGTEYGPFAEITVKSCSLNTNTTP